MKLIASTDYVIPPMSASVTQVFQKKDVLKEQERLMTLFSNRAELKRAYGQQRREAERLSEKLQQLYLLASFQTS